MSDEMPDKIAIDYIKSNSYRVVHCDGVWGGISPRMNIFMGIWSERPTIPQRVVHSIEDGQMGPEIRDDRVVREAFAVREMEVGLIMDLPLAKAMVTWLQDRISVLEKAALKEAPE